MTTGSVFGPVLAATIAALAAPAPAAAQQRRPNVIILLTDDQGYGDLSCHGNPVLKTPNLDRLHGQSVRLTDFHSAPMCTPTRGQLLTGQDALRNGATSVTAGRTFIRPGVSTAAEIFAAAGRRTGIFGKWHLGDNYPHRPHDRGFAEAVYHQGWGFTSAPEFANTLFDGRYFHNGIEKRFAGDVALPGGKRIPAMLELEFPRSKSWVQVAWTLADDDADVSGVRLELNLNLEGEPALVDFGAAGTVYARLRKGESAELLGGIAFGRFGVVPVERPWWRVSTGRTGALTPYVEQPKGQEQATVEGRAHVMDKTRCTAIAVERFSFDGAQDRIEISAEGRLRLTRDFAPADRRPERGKKSWRFWLHFVDMPVHVGAATSPQSILFPPTVQVVR
jgi:hypothetical protein